MVNIEFRLCQILSEKNRIPWGLPFIFLRSPKFGHLPSLLRGYALGYHVSLTGLGDRGAVTPLSPSAKGSLCYTLTSIHVACLPATRFRIVTAEEQVQCVACHRTLPGQPHSPLTQLFARLVRHAGSRPAPAALAGASHRLRALQYFVTYPA